MMQWILIHHHHQSISITNSSIQQSICITNSLPPEYGPWRGFPDDSVLTRDRTHRGAQCPRNGSCLCKSKHVGCAFDHFENEIISLSWGLYFPCKGTRLTPLSPQKDPWLSLFLGRSPDIGRLAEGLVLIHFQNVATNRFAGMETQAYRGKGFWGRASGWPGRESQCQTLLQTPSQTKTGLPKNLTHLPEYPLKINQNTLSKPKVGPNPEGDIHGPIHWSRLG